MLLCTACLSSLFSRCGARALIARWGGGEWVAGGVEKHL